MSKSLFIKLIKSSALKPPLTRPAERFDLLDPVAAAGGKFNLKFFRLHCYQLSPGLPAEVGEEAFCALLTEKID